MNREDLLRTLRCADLDLRRCIVVGSGPLCMALIRKVNDIDILAADDEFNRIARTKGWFCTGKSRPILRQGWNRNEHPIRIFKTWEYGEHRATFDDLRLNTDMIDGVLFLTLQATREWKSMRGSMKHAHDVSLINTSISRRTSIAS